MTTKKTILIVDDMPSNIELLYAILGSEYRILFASCGQEGLQMAIQNVPDLILLDVMMPDMDGYELCEKIKKHPLTMAIPVIFLTVLDHEDDEERGLEAGAIDYIAKPYNVANIKAKIRNHIAFKELLCRGMQYDDLRFKQR